MRYSKLPGNMCPTWSRPYTKLPDCVYVCVGVCAMPNSMSEVTSEHISQHARVDCLQPLLLEYMCAYNVRSLWCSCISNVSSQKKKTQKLTPNLYSIRLDQKLNEKGVAQQNQSEATKENWNCPPQTASSCSTHLGESRFSLTIPSYRTTIIHSESSSICPIQPIRIVREFQAFLLITTGLHCKI